VPALFAAMRQAHAHLQGATARPDRNKAVTIVEGERYRLYFPEILRFLPARERHSNPGTHMRNIFVSAAAAAGLLAFAYGAHAFPAASAAAGYENSGVILVEDGCGRGWHRGPEGRCRPDRERIIVAPRVLEPPVVVVEPRACPLGTHWSVRWHRCVL